MMVKIAFVLMVVLFALLQVPSIRADSCNTTGDCGTLAFNESWPYTCSSNICDRCDCKLDSACGWDEVCDCSCRPCRTSAECLTRTFTIGAAPGIPSPWVMIAFIAALISLLAASLVFAMGYVLNLQNVRHIGRAELMQAVASLILIALLFGAAWVEEPLVQMLESRTQVIAGSIFRPGQNLAVNPFDVSYAFLMKLIACSEKGYRSVYSASISSEFLSATTLSVTTRFPFLGIKGLSEDVFRLIPGISARVADNEYMADEYTQLLIILYGQMALFKFIETSMFSIFLPIGILLRAFPPTRGAGAVLIALSIAFYMVLPLTYTVLASSAPSAMPGCGALTVQMTGATKIQKACPAAPSSAMGMIGQATEGLDTSSAAMAGIKSSATNIRYYAFLYILIALGVAFIFARSVSPILGADISEIGRSMLRLI